MYYDVKELNELLVDITTWAQGDLNACRVDDVVQGEDNHRLQWALQSLEASGMIKVAGACVGGGVRFKHDLQDFIHVTPLGVLTAKRYMEVHRKEQSESKEAINKVVEDIEKKAAKEVSVEESLTQVVSEIYEKHNDLQPVVAKTNNVFNEWLKSL